jgi:hypothetical protein
MRRIVLFIISVTIGCYSLAQDSTFVADSLAVNDSILENDSTDIILLTDAMENAIIHQDSSIYRLLLDKYLGIERGQQEVSGFRVQVYSSNQQQKAKNESILLQQELEKKLSEPVYVISEPPFWKVRVGNFLTRDDANQHKESIIETFPELQSSTYVVPDKVIVLN